MTGWAQAITGHQLRNPCARSCPREAYRNSCCAASFPAPGSQWDHTELSALGQANRGMISHRNGMPASPGLLKTFTPPFGRGQGISAMRCSSLGTALAEIPGQKGCGELNTHKALELTYVRDRQKPVVGQSWAWICSVVVDALGSC